MPEKTGTKLVLLGTGTPVTDPQRQGPSSAVVVGDEAYIVDVGPGVVRRAAEAAANGIAALEPGRLRRAFVTHLHSDHTVGLADLMLTPWVMGRDVPLVVHGPEGIADMAHHLHAAYAADINVRVLGLEPTNDQGHRIIAEEIMPGVVYEDDRLRVDAFPVDHGVWPSAFGYAFTTDDRRIVISGDTAPTDILVEHAAGCDVLLHEVYSAAQFEQRSADWQRYHADYHTSTIELADIARRAKPALLVLYHQLFWGASPDELVYEVRSRYDGKVVSGSDLDVL